jgi:hypothetical protein
MYAYEYMYMHVCVCVCVYVTLPHMYLYLCLCTHTHTRVYTHRYVQSSTLSWQLRCFNEITLVTADCYGGEELQFAVGRSANETGMPKPYA